MRDRKILINFVARKKKDRIMGSIIIILILLIVGIHHIYVRNKYKYEDHYVYHGLFVTYKEFVPGVRVKHHSINPEDHKDGDSYVYKLPLDCGGGRLKVRRYSENNVSTYFVRKYNNKYYISIENKSLGKMDSIEDDFLWHLNRRASKIFKYWASLEGKDVNFGFWDCLYVIGH